MDEAGNTKDDLSLPKGTDDAEKLAQQIQEDFEAGKELVVTVLKVSNSSNTHAVSAIQPSVSRLFLLCITTRKLLQSIS